MSGKLMHQTKSSIEQSTGSLSYVQFSSNLKRRFLDAFFESGEVHAIMRKQKKKWSKAPTIADR